MSHASPVPSRRLILALPLIAAACAAKPHLRQDFPPLDFSYLPKLPLNVATLDVDNQASPLGPDDISAIAPVPPATALAQMARQRLRAAGTSGRAVFVIQRAAILRRADGLVGLMQVRLDISSQNGNPAGFASADISRATTPGPDLRATTDDLVRHMMDDMNVEFEYQLRHTLPTTLLTGANSAPVQSQPLPAP